MLSRRIIKRGLTGALVCAAVSFPAAAQAMVQVSGPGGADAAAQPAFQASGPRGGHTAPVAVSSGTAAEQGGSGFQWGDAGIGAAVAITALGAGAVSSGAARRRRTQRTVVG